MAFRHVGVGFIVGFFLVWSACTVTHEIGPIPPEIGQSATALVGPSGGRLALGNMVLEVPAGALAENTELRVEVVEEGTPFSTFSPVLRFAPEGLRFATPARIAVPFLGANNHATIFWRQSRGSSYVALRTTIEGGIASAEVQSMNRAFVGTACMGDDCCGQALGELDVLLDVDNSGSMREEQEALARELPRMARILATGDLDEDGVQDFPAVDSLHLGTVSTDMGTAGYAIQSCGSGDRGFDFGDDGVLRFEGAPLEGCAPTYPSYLTYQDGEMSDPDAFAHDVACVAQLGAEGCGFEQQFEASLKALTPSTSEMAFLNGEPGHGDTENRGLLREDSVLAVVTISDEDDCSVADPDFFNPNSTTYPHTSSTLNLLCHNYGNQAGHPVSRYVDGLLAVRSPDRLVYAAIVGMPTDLGTQHGMTAYDAILADPRMVATISPENPNLLTPTCETSNGAAFPGQRFVELARGISEAGAAGTVHSICSDDYSPAMSEILGRVASRLSGSCGAP